MKTTKQRKKERKRERFARQFDSRERVLFINGLPCEVTGRAYSIQNAHMRARRGSTYREVVPLNWLVHKHFDEQPEAWFEKRYNRTKQSIRDRAPHYHQLWLDSRGETT